MTSGAEPVDLSLYATILDAFITGNITVHEFEKQYTDTFLQEQRRFGYPFYDILNELFINIDYYVPHPELRTDPEDLDEDQLLQKAREDRDALARHLEA